jgi:transcriptional regulator with XRE-family HTH domain
MIETKGRAKLAAKLRPKGPHSQQWLASMLGVKQSSVSWWLNGKSRPEPHHRFALWLLWRIPQAAWFTTEEAAVIARVKTESTRSQPTGSPEGTASRAA